MCKTSAIYHVLECLCLWSTCKWFCVQACEVCVCMIWPVCEWKASCQRSGQRSPWVVMANRQDSRHEVFMSVCVFVCVHVSVFVGATVHQQGFLAVGAHFIALPFALLPLIWHWRNDKVMTNFNIYLYAKYVLHDLFILNVCCCFSAICYKYLFIHQFVTSLISALKRSYLWFCGQYCRRFSWIKCKI